MRSSTIALVGVGSLFLGWMLMSILPDTHELAWVLVVLGALFLAIAAVLDRKRLAGAAATRRARHGMGGVVKVCLLLGVVFLVNATSFSTYHRFDLTGTKRFTLTSATRRVLSELPQPVDVVAVFGARVPTTVRRYAMSLLDEYEIRSTRLRVTEIDPDVNPDQARRLGVDEMGALLGVVVFRGPEGARRVLGPQIVEAAEHRFTSALLEVTGATQKQVYFLTEAGQAGLSGRYEAATRALRDNLFQVHELSLQQTTEIPEDAAVVVIAGPRARLSTDSAKLVQDYLENDGRLFVLLDPDPPDGYADLLARWWVTIPAGTLVDPRSHVAPYADTILVPRERSGFQLGETFFPGATAVLPLGEVPEDAEVLPLAWTSREAWLDVDHAPLEESRRDEEADATGPFAIGALISDPAANEDQSATGTRVAVLGDSDFVSTPNFHSGNNGELFVRTVNWLAAGKELIAIEPTVLATRRLVVTPEQARFLTISSVGLLPLLVLAAGIVVWVRRRRWTRAAVTDGTRGPKRTPLQGQE